MTWEPECTDFIYEDFVEKTPIGGQGNTQESLDSISGQISATRMFEGSWEKRLDFVFEYLFGKVQLTDDDTTFLLPKAYPDIPSIYVSSVFMTGKGTPTYDTLKKRTIWERVVIEVFYTRKNNKSDGTLDEENYTNNVFIDESIDSHVEVLTVPGAEVEIDGVKQHEKGEELKVIPTATIILSRNDVIAPPWFFVNHLFGKVNSQVFITPSGYVCVPETLRFDGPTGKTKVNIFDGGGLLEEEAFPFPVWDFSLKFEHNPNGWNRKFVDGEFKVMRVNGKRKYALGDMWGLIFGRGVAGPFADQLNIINFNNAIIEAQLELGNGFDNPDVQNAIQAIKDAKAAMGFKL